MSAQGADTIMNHRAIVKILRIVNVLRVVFLVRRGLLGRRGGVLRGIGGGGGLNLFLAPKFTPRKFGTFRPGGFWQSCKRWPESQGMHIESSGIYCPNLQQIRDSVAHPSALLCNPR